LRLFFGFDKIDGGKNYGWFEHIVCLYEKSNLGDF
jgi:hypothetical protein